ncbi:unnamed protein product, partial [Effrenium voratum]
PPDFGEHLAGPKPHMPRFSEWAEQQRKESDNALNIAGFCIDAVARRELQAFQVDNSALCSQSSGLRYRTAEGGKNPALKVVPWGKVVWGVLDDAGEWLKVKPGRYLPVSVDGVQVLKAVEAEQVSEEEAAAPEPRLGSLKVPEKFRPAPEQSDLSEQGCWYKISAERVVLREGPSLGSAAISSLRRGARLELFGWDDTRKWRRCLEPRTALRGWVLLEHPDLGPLVCPQNPSLAWRPRPLCDAAAEGRLEDLRCFLQEGGDLQEALVLSAASNQLACLVRLIEAGADAAEALKECVRRGEELDVQSAALLSAAAGKSANQPALQLALKRLAEPERKVAEDQLKLKSGVMSKEALLEALEGEAATEAPDSPSPRAQAFEAVPRGELYEVVYQAVWIRNAPDGKGQQITKRMCKDRFRILGFDESGNWGKLKVLLREGEAVGWVMLQHPDLGELIRKCADNDERGGLLKPEEL